MIWGDLERSFSRRWKRKRSKIYGVFARIVKRNPKANSRISFSGGQYFCFWVFVMLAKKLRIAVLDVILFYLKVKIIQISFIEVSVSIGKIIKQNAITCRRKLLRKRRKNGRKKIHLMNQKFKKCSKWLSIDFPKPLLQTGNNLSTDIQERGCWKKSFLVMKGKSPSKSR